MPLATVQVKMRISGLAAVIIFYFHLHILAFSVQGGVPRGKRELAETTVGPTEWNEPLVSFSGNPRMIVPLIASPCTEGVVRMRASGGMAAIKICFDHRYGNILRVGAACQVGQQRDFARA